MMDNNIQVTEEELQYRAEAEFVTIMQLQEEDETQRLLAMMKDDDTYYPDEDPTEC